jgi:hypothetical protein
MNQQEAEMILLLAKTGEPSINFNTAFAAARALGRPQFQWQGKPYAAQTREEARGGLRLPRGMKESDLYRDPAREQPMRDSEARQQAIEAEYQQNLRNIRSEFETADKRDFQQYTSDMAPFEQNQLARQQAAQHLDDMRLYEAREAIEGPMQEEYERESLANRAEIERLAALQKQLQQEVYDNQLAAHMQDLQQYEQGERDADERLQQEALQKWAAGKRQEQALERVYPEALAPVGRAAVSTGKAGARLIDRLLRSRSAAQQARRRPRQEPDIDFSNLNNLMAP